MASIEKGVIGRRISRRSMVHGTALGIVFALSGRAARSVTIAGGYRPRYFNDAEWSTLAAFVERLIPPDSEGRSALEAHVPEFIDRQMMTPYGFGDLWYLHGPFVPDAPAVAGYQHPYSPREIYRLGFKSLNDSVYKRFNKHFFELKSDEQDAILKDLEHGTIELTPVPSKLLFSQTLKNCKEGYFSDPIHGGNAGMVAWKMIGFPGARADFTDFVNLNGAPYPLGPVSLLGTASRVKNGKN